ncbi:MAG: adenylosuccinate synthetase, partial [Chitinophagaceae bacterium]
SNTTSAGVCSGLGVAPQRIREVIGVSKAYCTRVGGGPFPTELHDGTGEELRRVGSEFGATTGRPRRCGWMDLVALKYACMINGVTQIVLTKADVLDAFPTLQVCTGYRVDGAATDKVPFQMTRNAVEPVYHSVRGWHTDSTACSTPESLPNAMKDYIAFINDELGTPVRYVSNGPGREQIVRL